jgi:peptidoglycan/xylan/chitin deacetylase (PgdA/CDA1 family)
MHDIVAPILLDKGISATFFVNSSFVDNKELCYEHKASILADKVEGLNSINQLREIGKLLTSNNISDVSDLKKGILTVPYKQRKVLDEIATIMDTDFNEYLSLNKPYLTSNQIRGLIKSGFSIGAHSIDHPHYSALTLEEQVVQTLECVKFVNKNFHLDYGAFAFPYQDDSVSLKFFSEVYDSGLVDISFGTGGMKKDIISRNLQRINFETPLMPAKRILALEHARKIYKTILGTNKIRRPMS